MKSAMIRKSAHSKIAVGAKRHYGRFESQRFGGVA